MGICFREIMAIGRFLMCRLMVIEGFSMLVVIERVSMLWVMVIGRLSPLNGVMERVWSVFFHNA